MTMRQTLDKTLRSALESTVIKARDVAEQAVREAIERLGVGEAQAPSYLTEAEKALRVKLRAHGRQLGDTKHPNGEHSIELLVSEAAYEHWHRMLFARFLEQNNLLMFDAHTHLTLDECNELAADEGFASGWAYASHLASKMLPQVFRQDSPVFQLELAINHIRDLENKIAAIEPQTFQAQDSLGWVYQFWQTKRKKEVNDSGVKIGAKELSPVTQLFTEPYMVSFLLDNALGAWWANRTLTANDIETAKTEQDLRERAAIPGVPLTYLRFVESAGEKKWQPAADTFAQWPQHLSELKALDPCCGSGHFLVATFLMLVPMRMAAEDLSAKDAVSAVLSQNIHGLELDQRCVELAAFALALEAWRFPNAGGYRTLPELHLACSGLSVSAAKAEWKALGIQLEDASGKKNLSIALDWLHQTFADAPVLGSLINPRKSDAAKIVQWDELASALNQALTINAEEGKEEQHEAGIAAQGLAKAATLLASEYSWVITNVPFRQMDDVDERLKGFATLHYKNAKTDLSTVFHERVIEFLNSNGSACVVLPQSFLYKDYYAKYRQDTFLKYEYKLLARLGAGAFKEITGEEVKVALSITRNAAPSIASDFYQIDASDFEYDEKPKVLISDGLIGRKQKDSLVSKKSVVRLHDETSGLLLEDVSDFSNGIQTGDYPRFGRFIWELFSFENWSFQLSTVNETTYFGGRYRCINWGNGELLAFVESKLGDGKAGSWIRGLNCQGKTGIAISAMGEVKATLYTGELFDDNTVVILPNVKSDLSSIWQLCSSPNYNENVRKIDQSSKVRGALLRVPYASHEGIQNLPKPYTNDPTQWIFHGHPCGSVIWHEQNKVTALGELRKDETVMQIALARLLGYQWPAELDTEMELAEEQRHWVKACEALAGLVDDDGIACIPAVRGEKPAADRLEAMLQAAHGDAWNINVQNELLAAVNASSLEAWLRDKFFEQHCKLFGHRPFIWQVWDGLKDGFSALINYHTLNADNLDRLIYTYLGDWIRTQEQGVKNGTDGADIRLAAAQNLHIELEAIKLGEAAKGGKSSYDIFVRWKPLHEQPIGWNPDLNDGVRLNIRPFLTAKDLGKKGAGILRSKPNIDWKKDRGTDVTTAPWYHLGKQYGETLGSRINDHHLTRAEKLAARENHAEEVARQLANPDSAEPHAPKPAAAGPAQQVQLI